MEKQIKNIYNLSCNWYMKGREEDASGRSKGSWTGSVVAYDDNSCIGYATDAGKQEPNQLLIGTVIDGKALSLCKINAYNFIYDPIFFHTFSNSLANSMGKNDSYYGEFFSQTMFDFIRLGSTSVQAKQREISENEVKKITSIYDDLSAKIHQSKDFGAMVLDMVEGLNQFETTKNIEDFSERMLHADLPIELQEEIFTQPNNG